MNTGDKLTIKHDIIGISGSLLFAEGQEVTVREVVKSGGYYSKLCGYWIDERVHGVKLQGHYGIWFLTCFKIE